MSKCTVFYDSYDRDFAAKVRAAVREEAFEDLQTFFDTTATLAEEKRLTRFAFCAVKRLRTETFHRR